MVFGAAGMLGQDVVAVAERAGHRVTGLGRPDLDITDAPAVLDAVAGHDVVVNCAGWTAVDDAETHEAEAFAVNATGAAHVARAATAAGARLVHVSTDFVFDGAATGPYAEDVPVSPRSAYGRTKAAGEWAVLAHAPDALVVRTAWLYGAGGRCFPRTIARAAGRRDRLSVVDDETGQPTWTADLADLIVRLVAAGAPGGLYHGTASGEVTWCGFARTVLATAGSTTPVDPTTSAAYGLPASRPAYSVLGHDRLRQAGVAPIGDWAERWKVAAPAVLKAEVACSTGMNLSRQAAVEPSHDLIVAQKTRSFYERFAQEYASSIPEHVTGAMKEWLDTLVSGVPHETPVFEIGSGTGRDAVYLESLGYRVQRSEIADSFIKAFEERGVDVVKFDVLNDSFPGSQHVVFANSVFCHLTNRQLRDALKNVYDALVPGGRLGFNTKSAEMLRNAMVHSELLPESRYFSYWPPDKLRAEVERIGFDVRWWSDRPAILRPTAWVNLVVEKPLV